MAWFGAGAPVPSVDDCGDPQVKLHRTERWWRSWAEPAEVPEEWADAVRRSLITLKALTYAPTGGICAAPTTSLPEAVGGPRNWDYRYCWVRDATFTLDALLDSGFEREADAWALWLRRAVAGSPDRLQIMYGLDGSRRLPELTLDWLPGYEGSTPVRTGNAASQQFQLDVYGEILDMLHTLVCQGRKVRPDSWSLAQFLVEHVAKVWTEPDEGIWEVRGPKRHFVHSKVMAWVAIDRWIKMITMAGRDEPLDQWHELRDRDPRRRVHPGRGSRAGLLRAVLRVHRGRRQPADVVAGRVPAAGRSLHRGYGGGHRAGPAGGRLRPSLPAPARLRLRPGSRRRASGGRVASRARVPSCCARSGWSTTSSCSGRHDEAVDLFERLLGLCNDVGLLSEEWDPVDARMLGNFPQAFSHVGMINTARNLTRGPEGPAMQRADRPGRSEGGPS